MNMRRLWLQIKERFAPTRRIQIVNDDCLPTKLPRRDLILVKDGAVDWCVGMLCPCGCGQRVELPLLPEAKPKWKIQIDSNDRPTLQPSVWLRDGCRSHYFVRNGRIVWV